jgi:phosphoenolpyruvate carboxykinase (ATP)
VQAYSSISLADQGLKTDAQIHWNLGTAPLIEAALKRGEGPVRRLASPNTA